LMLLTRRRSGRKNFMSIGGIVRLMAIQIRRFRERFIIVKKWVKMSVKPSASGSWNRTRIKDMTKPTIKEMKMGVARNSLGVPGSLMSLPVSLAPK
jgi:hypothetical protein